jgi:hypothetical protein
VCLTAAELAEVQTLASRERLSISSVLRAAARDAAGTPAPKPTRPASWDDGYDHALQQELSLLNLMATEQVIALLEAMAPYGQISAEEVLVQAAQAAQRRIARGIPSSLDGRDGGPGGPENG